MVFLHKVASVMAAALTVPMAFAQSSSCTCPSVSIFTQTVFYDPNTMMSSGMTMSGTSMMGGSTATGATSAASPSSTVVSPNVAVVVRALNAVTSQSQNLQAGASSLTTTNGPLIAIGQGPLPALIAGFSTIVSTATAAIPAFTALGSVAAGIDSSAIFDAFRDFVRVHQALLSILIGKAGLFTAVPIVGQPVAAALRGIEGIVDTIAFALINAVQTLATDLQSQASALTGSLDTAIAAYSGVSVTSATATM